MLSRRPAIGGRPRRRGASRRACAGAAISITDCLVGKCRASASVSIRHFRRRAGSMVSATAPDLIHVHDERPDPEVDTPAPRHGPPVSRSGRDALRCGVLFAEVIVLLAVATAGLVAGRALGLPSIVAYLVAGVLVGPGGLGLVSRSAAISELAELGVALLLFGVGIEFSLDRLRRILPRMVASGALQVPGSVAATALVFRALALPWPAALFTGFLVALALSGSPSAHQVFAELLPLRDAFVAIFFTSIGMLFEPAVIAGEPALLAGMVGAVLFKGLLITAIVGLFWRSARLAVLTGFGLAQIGEFSFVLARQGGAAGVISRGLEQAFLGAAIVTMAATPFLMRLGRRLALVGAATPGAGGAPELRDHVLVIGYGVTGQAVARVLRETGVPFVAVDMVADVVDAGRREGISVRFGDASRRGVLEEMGAERARAAVVAGGDQAATRRVVSQLRQTNPTARILVRVRRVGEIEELERLGADEAIPSEFETSIELFG